MVSFLKMPYQLGHIYFKMSYQMCHGKTRIHEYFSSSFFYNEKVTLILYAALNTNTVWLHQLFDVGVWSRECGG